MARRRMKYLLSETEKLKTARLIHVDYDCGGVVKVSSGRTKLACTKCRMTSLAGPITAVTQ